MCKRDGYLLPSPRSVSAQLSHVLPIIKLRSPFSFRIYSSKMNDFIQIKLEKES